MKNAIFLLTNAITFSSLLMGDAGRSKNFPSVVSSAVDFIVCDDEIYRFSRTHFFRRFDMVSGHD